MFNPRSMRAMGTLGIIAILLAIIATIVICIVIMPKKKRPQLTGFALKLHDIVNFKSLIIEKILKVLYVFSTCSVILIGIFSIFSGTNFFACLVIIVVGPFIVRLIYEGLMLVIVAVQNIIEINNKLPAAGLSARPEAQAAPAQAAPQPNYRFCTQCGTRYDANAGPCPNCGSGN